MPWLAAEIYLEHLKSRNTIIDCINYGWSFAVPTFHLIYYLS